MDSVTQFVLGAGVGAAVLGPRIGARKAVILGGLLGTMPDLDVYLPFDDPVDAFTLHRGATHSLVVHALATPLFAELLRLVTPGLKAAGRTRIYLAVFLVLATHALLDAMTVYGTRLFWPISTEPFAVGSIFIIDPFYTLPLLIITVWSLVTGGWSHRLRRWVAGTLVISTAYLGWSVVAQGLASDRAEGALAAAGLTSQVNGTISSPLPFNTILWRTLAVTPTGYFNIYDSLAAPSDSARTHWHPSDTAAMGCLQSQPKFDQLTAFSKGFFTVSRNEGGEIFVSDLRMGVTPDFAFTFKLAELGENGVTAVDPVRILAESRSREGDWDWMLSGLLGDMGARPSERQALVTPSSGTAVAEETRVVGNC